MNCPHCNATLEFDGDFHNSEVSLDPDEVNASVEITLICDSCFEDLGQYSFELVQDITDFTADHEDPNEHELSVDLSNEEFIETHINDAHYLGAAATITVSCICGSVVSYQCSATELATEVMKELE